MLFMTATPIPRTLAMVQYGSMELSTIHHLPPGRSPIKTQMLEDNALGRAQVREEEGLGCCCPHYRS